MKCWRVFILLGSFLSSLSVYGSDRTLTLNAFIRKAEAAEQVEVDKNRGITWIGPFTTREKEKLLKFFEQEQEQFKLPEPPLYSNDIVKSDLDGDGQVEYLMHLNFSWPASYFPGRVLALVIESKEGFQIRVVSGPELSVMHREGDFGIVGVKLRAIDFDGDGLKDIVETKILEEDPEDPKKDSYYSVIYKNFKINGEMRFKDVYRKIAYDYPRFEDLDKNGKLELLETVSEFRYETYMSDPKWRWVNIYEWDGRGFAKANEKHLGFYLKKEKEYKVLLKEAMEKDAGFKKKGKQTIYETAVQAMEAYLKRIEEMKRKSPRQK